MIIKVELVREDGSVVTSDQFNTQAGLVYWEAPITAPIIDHGQKIFGYEIKIHQRPVMEREIS